MEVLCFVSLDIDQVDIIEAYLESLLTENNLLIFMKLSPRIEKFRLIRARLVACLLQSLYRFKQWRRSWNKKVVTFLKSLGFIIMNVDQSIFICYKENNEITMISIYINDFLLRLKYWKLLDRIKNLLNNKYNVSDFGKMKFIIRWQVI